MTALEWLMLVALLVVAGLVLVILLVASAWETSVECARCGAPIAMRRRGAMTGQRRMSHGLCPGCAEDEWARFRPAVETHGAAGRAAQEDVAMMTLKPSVMIDIETMGRRPGCAIWQIAAVRFGPEGVERDDAFNEWVDLRSCVDVGLTLEPETVQWWMEQGGYPNGIQPPWSEPLAQALLNLQAWMKDSGSGTPYAQSDGLWVWANSPTFDCEILAAAFEASGWANGRKIWDALAPWQNHRDFRTLRKVLSWMEGPERPEGSKHDALADAIWQAEWVVEAYQAMQATADRMQMLMRDWAMDGGEVGTLEGASGGWTKVSQDAQAYAPESAGPATRGPSSAPSATERRASSCAGAATEDESQGDSRCESEGGV